MSSNKQTNKKVNDVKKKNNTPLYVAGIIAVIIIAFFIVKGLKSGNSTAASDIKIIKSEITETAKFYPYKAGGNKAELLAVKASDGTIRTAFNTCQVCYDSGRGYYKQEGDELVCQNCGNRFKIDQVEKQKNGCNPVPILDGNKTDDGTTITISKDFLAQAKDLFGNWKKG